MHLPCAAQMPPLYLQAFARNDDSDARRPGSGYRKTCTSSSRLFLHPEPQRNLPECVTVSD